MFCFAVGGYPEERGRHATERNEIRIWAWLTVDHITFFRVTSCRAGWVYLQRLQRDRSCNYFAAAAHLPFGQPCNTLYSTLPLSFPLGLAYTIRFPKTAVVFHVIYIRFCLCLFCSDAFLIICGKVVFSISFVVSFYSLTSAGSRDKQSYRVLTLVVCIYLYHVLQTANAKESLQCDNCFVYCAKSVYSVECLLHSLFT